VKPAPFEYHCPRTLDEALTLLAEHGSDAKPLAGGQSLIPAMNFRLATPAVLIDLNAIDELSFIHGDGAEPRQEGAASAAPIRIGAMVRHRQLERSALVATRAPLITKTMPFVAHPAIRTRGTLGGSLAHADPAAELPAAMLALNAQFMLSSRARSRSVSANDFFVGLFTTALEPGELLTEVIIPPLPARSAHAFAEVSRRHGDFALAGVAAVVAMDDAGNCTDARIALLSVGDRPLLAMHAARALIGHRPSREAIRAAADAAAHLDIDPPSDMHASSRYRRQLVNVLTRRTLEEALRTP
jgi:carbon-monoxide dehydrogenase medium subunit